MARVSKIQQRLNDLEKEVKSRGVRLGYERLQYAGLMLKSGMCWFKGTYYLFVDKRKKVRERIDMLQGALEDLDLLKAEGRLDSPQESDGHAAPSAAPDSTPDDQDDDKAGGTSE